MQTHRLEPGTKVWGQCGCGAVLHACCPAHLRQANQQHLKESTDARCTND